MSVTDIDSIIHLLQSISGWGLFFLVLVVLPLYVIGWAAVVKLLNLSSRQSGILVVVLAIAICVSLVLLKIGINQDRALITKATLIKKYILQSNVDFIDLQRLRDVGLISQDSASADPIIERFPESFCYTWLGKNKALQIIDPEASAFVDKVNEKMVPVVYSELTYAVPKDSVVEFQHLRDSIDNRINFIVLEKIITKYPDEFVEVSRYDYHANMCYSYIKRIK